jgi:hypothetical protein
LAAITHGRCAASLYRDADNWQDIEGLQTEGAVQPLEAGKESVRILTAYVEKFPTLKQFFNESELDFSRFCELFHSQLFAFAPTLVFYINNRDGLASQREITAIFPALSEPSSFGSPCRLCSGS